VVELKRRVPEVEVVWRAYELRPEPAPLAARDYLERAWRQSVYPMAERLGVPMRLPPNQAYSRLAHEAALWARAAGAFDAMNGAIFRAFFERGEDIGDADVLVRLAESAGLDGAALRESLERHEHLGAVLADEAAAERYGLRGVPAFVCGGYGLVGVQSADTLEAFVERAGGTSAGPGAAEEPPGGITRRRE